MTIQRWTDSVPVAAVTDSIRSHTAEDYGTGNRHALQPPIRLRYSVMVTMALTSIKSACTLRRACKELPLPNTPPIVKAIHRIRVFRGLQ